MDPSVIKRKQIAGLEYGMVAGLAFAVFAWGIDGYLLTRAHAAYPWVKFASGLLVCVPAGGLAGWLTMLYKRTSFITFTWIGLAILFSRLVLWNPMWIMPRLIGIFDQAMGKYLNYSETRAISETVWFGSIIVLVVSIGCGLLEKNQINEYVYSRTPKDFLVPMFICATLFGLAGGVSDTLINKKFREPIQALDQMIQFSLDHTDQDVPDEVAQSMNLDAFAGIKGYMSEQRKLIPSSFQPSIDQVDVLVVFKGLWVKCTTVFSRVASCEQAIKTPEIKRSFLNGIFENGGSVIHRYFDVLTSRYFVVS